MISEIISKLKTLDLNIYPYSEVKSLIERINRSYLFSVEIQPGKNILRGRTNQGKRFYSRAEFSYKPQEFNSTYQRASTPYNTMFYGCIVPPIKEKFIEEEWRINVVFETFSLMEQRYSKGVQKITFGKWNNIEALQLIVIVNSSVFSNPHIFLNELSKMYLEFVNHYPENKVEAINYMDFIGNEFGKSVNSGEDYQYLISSVFSQYVCELGFDGVLYASVKMKGKGFNVALTPEAVDKKLKWTAAGEGTIYKNGEMLSLSNETFSFVNDQRFPVNYSKIPKPDSTTEAECLKAIGIDHINQLK